MLTNASDNRFEGNSFSGNSFDVSINSRTARAAFRATGGITTTALISTRERLGDVPYRPVRLFSLVEEPHKPALILLRSPLVGILDAAKANADPSHPTP